MADFIIHVLDVANPHFEHHQATTLGVLAELGAADKTILTVFNKIDIAEPGLVQQARHLVPDALFVSAHAGTGLGALEDRCLELIADTLNGTELLVPHERYDVIARLHSVGHVHSSEQRDDGVHLRGRYPAAQAAYFAPFVVGR